MQGQSINSSAQKGSGRFIEAFHAELARMQLATHLNPICLYPAALTYHLVMGCIHLWSQGRFRTKLTALGADMAAVRKVKEGAGKSGVEAGGGGH